MRRIQKLGLGGLLAFFLSFIFLNYILGYIIPFIIAVILASLIEPVVKFLEEEGQFSRGLSVAIILLLILFLIILIFTIALSRIFIELERLAVNLPDYHSIGKRIGWFLDQNENIGFIFQELEISERLSGTIGNNLQQLYKSGRLFIEATFISLLEGAKKFPRIITILFISLISTFFISKDKEVIMDAFLKPLPQELRLRIKKMQMEMFDDIVGFLRAQIILITITMIIAIIGLLIIRSEYAIVVGILCGVLDLIPVIGPGLIFTPWILYNLIFGDLSLGVSLLVIYIVITLIRQSAEAKIIGNNIGVHPLASLVAIYVGVQIFGIMGFILGPLILIVVKAVFQSGIISFVI
ncbi:sporulation integral membrane protein YtvI [Halonatronum saccharophilum]|uniref:sporulation integral membrane protein YtvI n=1 Tax=Halonatronum saccharophilum TaxID=150060 RepID=UPI0004833D05|nr:sporulation integral membrane protein YtvI [Halonatronum saccharophilum]